MAPNTQHREQAVKTDNQQKEKPEIDERKRKTLGWEWTGTGRITLNDFIRIAGARVELPMPLMTIRRNPNFTDDTATTSYTRQVGKYGEERWVAGGTKSIMRLLRKVILLPAPTVAWAHSSSIAWLWVPTERRKGWPARRLQG